MRPQAVPDIFEFIFYLQMPGKGQPRTAVDAAARLLVLVVYPGAAATLSPHTDHGQPDLPYTSTF